MFFLSLRYLDFMEARYSLRSYSLRIKSDIQRQERTKERKKEKPYTRFVAYKAVYRYLIIIGYK